jgi:hypothetical protein
MNTKNRPALALVFFIVFADPPFYDKNHFFVTALHGDPFQQSAPHPEQLSHPHFEWWIIGEL